MVALTISLSWISWRRVVLWILLATLNPRDHVQAPTAHVCACGPLALPAPTATSLPGGEWGAIWRLFEELRAAGSVNLALWTLTSDLRAWLTSNGLVTLLAITPCDPLHHTLTTVALCGLLWPGCLRGYAHYRLTEANYGPKTAKQSEVWKVPVWWHWLQFRTYKIRVGFIDVWQ